ncbi:hypothetical protein EMCRGX_G028730 [Ephydatia muelleri]
MTVQGEQLAGCPSGTALQFNAMLQWYNPALISPLQEPQYNPALISPLQEPQYNPALISPLQEPQYNPALISPLQEPQYNPALISPLQEAQYNPALISPLQEPQYNMISCRWWVSGAGFTVSREWQHTVKRSTDIPVQCNGTHDGNFRQNLTGHKAIANTLAINMGQCAGVWMYLV